MFRTEKLEWWGYQKVKKFEYKFARFDTIHKRDKHADGRTDIQGQMDNQKENKEHVLNEYARSVTLADF